MSSSAGELIDSLIDLNPPSLSADTTQKTRPRQLPRARFLVVDEINLTVDYITSSSWASAAPMLTELRPGSEVMICSMMELPAPVMETGMFTGP